MVLESLSAGEYTIKLQPHSSSYPLTLTIFGSYVAYHPSVISNLTATDGIASTVNITWTTAIGATYYELYRSEVNGSNDSIIDVLQTNSFIDNTIVADTLYYYRVKSCNDMGCSNYSSTDSGYIGTINEPPVANAGTDKSIEVNKVVSITGTASDSDGTIASAQWSINGQTIATSLQFNYTPTMVGTDTLTLTVTDDDGATASESMKVTVTNPLKNINLSSVYYLLLN